MDILFSPYGLGGLPKKAMTEVEQRAEALVRTSSFQRMLELEKKYKIDRLRGAQALLPSPQSPSQIKDGPPPRPQRPDSLFPQEEFLMVKATRRTVILPSLSIAIPHPTDDEKRGRLNEGEGDHVGEEDADIGTPTNSEPLQKQVKFLAPEDSDGEDGMSEQSSICQSPSWEGYGQRKKEKKLEAERRKREKEQTEKEAKAARKRNTARLSKPPPPPATASCDLKAVDLADGGRSTSDPLLISRHLVPSTQSAHRPEDVGRVASADGLPQSQRHRSPATGGLSVSSSSTRRTGGDTMDEPNSSAISHHLLREDPFLPRQDLRRSMSEGLAPPIQQPFSVLPSRHETRAPRDAFPPSASRTPMLWNMSSSGNNLGTTVFQGAEYSNHSQEPLSRLPTADGARQNGYVLYQRAQAAERAMAGLADEQLVGSVGQYCQPSRPSSAHNHHARRSSLTQEAKSAAMRLVGVRRPSSAQDDGTNQTDYLTFKAIPYSASNSDATQSVGSVPTPPKSADGPFRGHVEERPLPPEAPIIQGTNVPQGSSTNPEWPPTARSSISSSRPSGFSSTASSHSKKTRSLKDAAKAALSMSKVSQKPADNSKPTISVPPYFAFRSRMRSRTSTHAESQTAVGHDAAAASACSSFQTALQSSTSAASASDAVKPTETGAQGQGCYRASEGSSSSSACEDGSPLPSLTTTPDTSRPQSAKDVPLIASGLTEGTPESFGLQDDERTLRQSLDSSKSSTPRAEESEARERIEVGNEDRWSRAVLPIDIDHDAQSFTTFTTSVSNLDDMDEVETAAPNWSTSQQAKNDHMEPLKQASGPDMQARDTEPVISIPPRSRKRGQSMSERPSGSPVASSPAEQGYGNVGIAPVPVGVSGGEHDEMANMGDSSTPTPSGNYIPPEQTEGSGGKQEMPEGHRKRPQRKQMSPLQSGRGSESTRQRDKNLARAAPGSPQRDWASGPMSPAGSTIASAGPASPRALTSGLQISSNPYFADIPEPLRHHAIPGDISSSAGPPSPISLPSPLHRASRPAAQPRTNSAPTPPSAPAAPSRTSTPSTRPSGITPVSILKQPKASPSDLTPPSSGRPPVLSALPKHMLSARPPAVAVETRMAPIAKMLVECCSCKFYHDMPSKIYECMAKPDAVVEDRDLGISGSITTMVKCPWCQHNMSRNCCAGYAAVVYLKEKLH